VYGPAFQACRRCGGPGTRSREVAVPRTVVWRSTGWNPSALLDAALHAAGWPTSHHRPTAGAILLATRDTARRPSRTAPRPDHSHRRRHHHRRTQRYRRTARADRGRTDHPPLNTEHLQAALTAAAGETGQGLLEVVWSPITVDTGPVRVDVLSWNDFHDTPQGPTPPLPALVGMWWCGVGFCGCGCGCGGGVCGHSSVLEVLQSWLPGIRRQVGDTDPRCGGLTGHESPIGWGGGVGIGALGAGRASGRIMLIDTDTPVDVARWPPLGNPN